MSSVYKDYQFIRLTSSGIVKKGSGILGGFIVASGTPTVALYDNTAGSGTLILNTMQTAGATPYEIPVRFDSLYAVITGAGDITFWYR
jgi:hypothetical protein